jgi:hypothetical protein
MYSICALFFMFCRAVDAPNNTRTLSIAYNESLSKLQKLLRERSEKTSRLPYTGTATEAASSVELHRRRQL